MKCKLKNREEVIEKYLDKSLGEKETELFEKHLFTCDDCFNDVLIRQQLGDLVKTEGRELFTSLLSGEDMPGIKSPEPVFERYRPKYWLLIPAAAAIIFIAGYLVIQTLSGDKPGKNNIVSIFKDKKNKTTPVRKEKVLVNEQKNAGPDQIKTGRPGNDYGTDNQLLAQNFIESPNFENLITQHFRTVLSTEIKTPALNSIYNNGKITFEWKTGSSETIILKIYNNIEQLLYTSRTNGNQIAVDLNLKPGLFYWKLETEEDLLYVGRFLVK